SPAIASSVGTRPVEHCATGGGADHRPPMERLKIALLGLVAILLLIQILDRSREPQQMHELKKSLDRLSAELARGVTTHAPPVTGAPTTDPAVPAGPRLASTGPEVPLMFPLP